MGGKCKRNCTNLRSERKPGNCTVGNEQMAASTSSGGRRGIGVIGRKARGRPESDRKVSEKNVVWVWDRQGAARRSRSRRGSRGGIEGNTFERVMRIESRWVIGDRPSCLVSELELKGDL